MTEIGRARGALSNGRAGGSPSFPYCNVPYPVEAGRYYALTNHLGQVLNCLWRVGTVDTRLSSPSSAPRSVILARVTERSSPVDESVNGCKLVRKTDPGCRLKKGPPVSCLRSIETTNEDSLPLSLSLSLCRHPSHRFPSSFFIIFLSLFFRGPTVTGYNRFDRPILRTESLVDGRHEI